MGPFVTFEGIEGCGKTTQIRMAADYLRERGISIITTEEPGGTPFGIKIREIVLNQSSYSISAEGELLLFAAARAQHVKDVILPALKDNSWVLCDRFSDATIAYQGFGRGLSQDFMKTLHHFTSAALKPNLTILFDLPVEQGLKRALARIHKLTGVPAEDRFEREDLEFHCRVQEGYRQIANAEPERFRIIDSSAEISVIAEQVIGHLAALIEAHHDVANTA